MVATSLRESYWSRQHVRPLEGTWDDELGSELVLEDEGGGLLAGTYRSGTGATAGAAYSVVGSYDATASGPGPVLGFVVNWGEHHSLTVWSGRYCPEDETIRATWLMTTAQNEEKDEWRSTFVGHDTFRRRAPTGPARAAAHRGRWLRRVRERSRPGLPMPNADAGQH